MQFSGRAGEKVSKTCFRSDFIITSYDCEINLFYRSSIFTRTDSSDTVTKSNDLDDYVKGFIQCTCFIASTSEPCVLQAGSCGPVLEQLFVVQVRGRVAAHLQQRPARGRRPRGRGGSAAAAQVWPGARPGGQSAVRAASLAAPPPSGSSTTLSTLLTPASARGGHLSFACSRCVRDFLR